MADGPEHFFIIVVVAECDRVFGLSSQKMTKTYHRFSLGDGALHNLDHVEPGLRDMEGGKFLLQKSDKQITVFFILCEENDPENRSFRGDVFHLSLHCLHSHYFLVFRDAAVSGILRNPRTGDENGPYGINARSRRETDDLFRIIPRHSLLPEHIAFFVKNLSSAVCDDKSTDIILGGQKAY